MVGLAPTALRLKYLKLLWFFIQKTLANPMLYYLSYIPKKIKKHGRIRTCDHEVMSLEYCGGLPYGKRFTRSIQLSYAFL
jgi:hypothetical protein